MSRIGKNPILIPEKVEVTITGENLVVVKGPNGELAQKVDPSITVIQNGNQLELTRENNAGDVRSKHGL